MFRKEETRKEIYLVILPSFHARATFLRHYYAASPNVEHRQECLHESQMHYSPLENRIELAFYLLTSREGGGIAVQFEQKDHNDENLHGLGLQERTYRGPLQDSRRCLRVVQGVSQRVRLVRFLLVERECLRGFHSASVMLHM